MAVSYYLRPDKLLTFQVGATGLLTPATVTGSVDSGYQANWLCDGRGHYPFRAPAGEDLAVSIAGFSQTCGMAVLHSHTLDAVVDLEISGGIVATLGDRGGDRPNRIPWNRWEIFTPVSASNVSVVAEYNSRDIVIGELLIGERFTIDTPQPGLAHKLPTFAVPINAEFAGGNGYTKGMAGGRTLTFSQAFTKDELEAVEDGLMAWFESCLDGTLPTAFVPNSDKDDVIVGTITDFSFEDQSEWVVVTFTIEEYTRQLWTLSA